MQNLIGKIIKVPPDINDVGHIRIVGQQKVKPDSRLKVGFDSDYFVQSYDQVKREYIGQTFNATKKEIEEWLQYEKDFSTQAARIRR